jgi:hypothetical protein
MALGVKLPSGTVVNVEDLPLVVWEGIARAGGLEVREWPHVAMAPGGYPKAANELIAVCARHVGEDEPPAGYLTLGNLAAVFHEIAEEPDPKAAGDPETTG